MFVSKLKVIDYTFNCAFFYGELRAEPKQKGIIIGSNDLLIASHTLSKNATLVTNNISEFSRIRSLSIENWELLKE